jgi:hypothetical protein
MLRRTAPVFAALVLVTAALFVLALLIEDSAGQGTRATARPTGSAGRSLSEALSTTLPTVDATATVVVPPTPMALPSSFLGLSTEYWTLPIWERHPLLLERVVKLLEVDGPLVLRIGGDSADRSLWSPTRELQAWVYELTPQWLSQARRVVQETDAHVILDLDYVTATPRVAVAWARAAEAVLPTRSIVAFEIGNEPDIYRRSLWLRVTAAGLDGTGLRSVPIRMTASAYALHFPAYARALAETAPGVPLLGPALANPAAHANWISSLVAHPEPGLAAVTVHRYPYSACASPFSHVYPTIARVLSEHATAWMASSIGRVVRIAARAGLPVRVTELNSVTCGGRPGVSNAFATALWAPDALFELARTGVVGVEVHVRADAVNRAFALTAHGLIAEPLFYGLMTFVRTLGPDARLLTVEAHARPSQHLKVWAVLVGNRLLHVLVIDKSKHPAQVALSLPALGPATVQRLLAPSVSSTSHVTLGGQWLAPDGRWVGRPQSDTILPWRGAYLLRVPGYSAALISAKFAPAPR